MGLRKLRVPGLTDHPQELRRVAEFGASLGVVELAEKLPFHQMGHYNRKRLGIEYALDATEPPFQGAVDAAVAIFRESGSRAD
jgi:pyruvate formate lyase activating enzyme